MKHFVVFSDLHLHQWVYGSHVVNGRNSRLEQQKKVVQSIVKYCNDRDIYEAVFTGDLFHTSTVTSEVLQAAYEAFNGFKETGIQLSLLVGNHDQSSRTGGSHSLSFFNELGSVFDVAGDAYETRHKRSDKTIAGIPAYFFPYTDSSETLRGYFDTVGSERSLIFCHQGVGGVEINSKGFTINEILTPDLIPTNCAMAFSGHYHSFKPVTSNLIIPGSTVQLNWGDEGEPRGWLDVTVDGEQVTEIQFIESQASKFITLHEDDLDAHSRETPLPNLAANYVRMLSTGAYSPEELTKTLAAFGPASIEIKPIYKENVATKLNVSTVASLNEIIYGFAGAKEKAGIISTYDKSVGESLLKGNYQVPQL